jgi:hypothetical protein
MGPRVGARAVRMMGRAAPVGGGRRAVVMRAIMRARSVRRPAQDQQQG